MCHFRSRPGGGGAAHADTGWSPASCRTVPGPCQSWQQSQAEATTCWTFLIDSLLCTSPQCHLLTAPTAFWPTAEMLCAACHGTNTSRQLLINYRATEMRVSCVNGEDARWVALWAWPVRYLFGVWRVFSRLWVCSLPCWPCGTGAPFWAEANCQSFADIGEPDISPLKLAPARKRNDSSNSP